MAFRSAPTSGTQNTQTGGKFRSAPSAVQRATPAPTPALQPAPPRPSLIKQIGQKAKEQIKFVKSNPKQAAKNVGRELVSSEIGLVDTYKKVASSLKGPTAGKTAGNVARELKDLAIRSRSLTPSMVAVTQRAAQLSGKTPTQVAGEIGGTALDIGTLGLGEAAVKGGVKMTGRQALKQLVKPKTLATESAIGAGQFGARTAQEGGTPKEIATSAAIGAGVGPIAATGLGAVGVGLKSIFGRVLRRDAIPAVSKSEVQAVNEKATSLAKFVENTPDLEVKTMKTLGRDINNKPIRARFEYDAKRKSGTIYMTGRTNERDLAEEVGHYLDKKIDPEFRQQLLDNTQIPSIVANKNITPNERFAKAVAEVITKPNARKKAPALFEHVNQFIDLGDLPTPKAPKIASVPESAAVEPVPAVTSEVAPAPATRVEVPVSSKIAEPGVIGAKGTSKLTTPSYNPNKINAVEDIESLIEETSRIGKAGIDKQRRGSVSNEQLKELSMMTNVSVDDLKKAKPGSIANPETVLKARQTMVDMAGQLSEFTRQISGRASKDDLMEFKKRLNDFMAVQKTVAGFRTEAGRLLQQFNVEIKVGENSALEELIRQVATVDKGAASELDKVTNLNKVINPTNLSNWLAVWKAGLLTNPVTHLKNIVGNAANSVLLNISDYPAAATDALISLGTGKRAKSVGGVFAGLKGGAEGLAEAGEILFKGSGQSNKFEAGKQIKFNNSVMDKTIGGYARTVFNLLQAEDRSFYMAAYRRSLSDTARVASKNTGQSVKDLLANPTDDMLAQAVADAETATFQGLNPLSKGASGLKRGIGQASEVILPFTRTPAGIAKAIIDYSPLGIPFETVTQLYTKEFNQRSLSEAIGKSITGSGVLSIGYILGQRGLVTGTYPSEEKERKLWELIGKQPNSILTNGKWRRLDSISPVGNIVAVGADMANQAKSGSGLKDLGIAYLGTVGKSLTEMSFLQGLSSVLDTLNDPERNAQKFLENTVSSIVPAAISAVARGVDQTVRKPKGVVQAVMSRIPELSKKLPARKDVFQDTIKREGGVPAQLLAFTRPQTANDSPLLNELTRLSQTGNTPSLTDIETRSDRVKNLKAQITDDKYKKFLSDFGQEYKKGLERTIKSGEYKRASDEKKKKILDDSKEDSLAKVLKKYHYKEPKKKK